MHISIALKHTCKLCLVESSPKHTNNDSLSHVVDGYVWKNVKREQSKSITMDVFSSAV